MQNSDRSIFGRTSPFFCLLVLLSLVQESMAQVENAVVLESKTSLNDVEFVAGQAAGANPQPDQFLQLLDQAIDITSKRTLTANAHSPWQIFHCILAMRRETVLRLGNDKVNAIDWLSSAEPQFDNQPWLLLTPHGAKFHSYTRLYAFEGHPSQFLALLTHSNLPLDHEFHVQGKVVTLNDLINNTMKEVNTAEEVTWVLWALQHYLKPDVQWVNQANESWSIERLVQIEANAPVVGTPCGGNHRLFALTRARDKYLQSGGKLRGAWYQADQKIKQHIEIARSLQNSDGSFSSDWYKGANFTHDVNPRFNTTGHTLEFLAISLPNDRLNDTWVRNAVWMLSRELIYHRDTKIDCGPLFHSLDALILYRDRIRQKGAGAELANPTPPKTISSPKELSAGIAAKPGADVKTKIDPPKPIRISKLPTEIITDETDPKAVPIPIPEKTVVPENGLPRKVEEPASTGPQANLQRSKDKSGKGVNSQTVASKSSKPVVPQIDPSKLPNVGQVAPRGRNVASQMESFRIAHRDHPLLEPPALLPDASESPVSVPDSSVPTLNQQPTPLDLDSEGVSIELENGISAARDCSRPMEIGTETSTDGSLPASALDPVNSEQGTGE